MCDAVACDPNGARLAGKARPHVVPRSFCEDPLGRSLIDRQTCVETRNRQDADPGSRRRLAGGSGMGNSCNCSEEQSR